MWLLIHWVINHACYFVLLGRHFQYSFDRIKVEVFIIFEDLKKYLLNACFFLCHFIIVIFRH